MINAEPDLMKEILTENIRPDRAIRLKRDVFFKDKLKFSKKNTGWSVSCIIFWGFKNL